MTSKPLVTINLVVRNGEKYIHHCLDSIASQTYSHGSIEVNVLDNHSLDNTPSVIENFKFKILNFNFSKFNLIKSELNLGMWPGQEKLLKYSGGDYIIALAVDVILDKDFIERAVETLEKDSRIGALQPKIYRFDLQSTTNGSTVLGGSPVLSPSVLSLGMKRSPSKDYPHFTDIVDTLGFQIYKSRRVTNIGHGEKDKDQFSKQKEIFAVEGAAPVFRKSALESLKILGKIVDEDFFWYGDDLDLAWRMRLFGWREIFAPEVIAWHDRQTTKSLKKHWWDYLTRIGQRKKVPIFKRRLDWRNLRFTIIKNDYTINILKDLPFLALREMLVLGYSIFFEPEVLLEVPNFFKLLPRMLKRRSEVMKKAIVAPSEIRKWFR